MKKCNEKGTVTLEACIVVPIFIILMLLICGLFIMFMGRQMVSHAVIQAAKSMSFDPYYTERMDSNPQKELNELFGDLLSINDNYVSVRKWYSDDSSKLSSVASDRVSAYLKEKGNYSQVNSMLNTFGVVGGAGGLRFSDSKVEDGVLTLKVSYKQKFPLDATGLASFDRSITVKVRLFTWSKLPNSIYEVGFNSNGGTPVSNKITDQSNGELPTPTKPGHVFVGWSTDPDSDTPDVNTVDDAKEVGENGDGSEMLYAIWEPISTCTYVSDGVYMKSIGEKGVTADLKNTFDFDVLKAAGYKTITLTMTFIHDAEDKHNLDTTLKFAGKEYNWDKYFDYNRASVTYTVSVPIDDAKNGSTFELWWDLEGVNIFDAKNRGAIGDISIQAKANK